MGATESTSIVNSKSSISGLVVPAFLKSMSRIILAILVVGGSYFGVSEGLRFSREAWRDFLVSQINDEIDGLELAVNDKEVLGIKSMNRAQIEKALYVAVDDRLRCAMQVASIEEIIKN